MKHRKPRRADWRKKPAKKRIERAFILRINALPDQFKSVPLLRSLVEMSFGFSMETKANGDGTYTQTFTAPEFDA